MSLVRFRVRAPLFRKTSLRAGFLLSGISGRYRVVTERYHSASFSPFYQNPDHCTRFNLLSHLIRLTLDPAPTSGSIQKQNSGMINTPLSGGGANEKVTIHRRADCPLPAGRVNVVVASVNSCSQRFHQYSKRASLAHSRGRAFCLDSRCVKIPAAEREW